MDIQSNVKEITIEAVVIRKDGEVENLGVVSHWSKERDKLLKKLRIK